MKTRSNAVSSLIINCTETLFHSKEHILFSILFFLFVCFLFIGWSPGPNATESRVHHFLTTTLASFTTILSRDHFAVIWQLDYKSPPVFNNQGLWGLRFFKWIKSYDFLILSGLLPNYVSISWLFDSDPADKTVKVSSCEKLWNGCQLIMYFNG